MKEHTPPVRASHVNQGTSIARAELGSPATAGRVFRHPKLQVFEERGEATAYGGLALAATLVRSLGLHRELDRALDLLQSHRPFTESDHVLTHVYNLFVGGSCIEDIAHLQGSEPVRRMLGAARIPDPTTAGDFLRRFDAEALGALDRAIDRGQEMVWKRRYGRRKATQAIVDLDSHVHPVYGDQKEGADFSYKGSLAYHPLVISLAETQECLRLINRPGNTASAEGAERHLAELFPMLLRRFRQVVVRGDSAFCSQKIFDACEAHGQCFAVVSPAQKNFEALAEALPEAAWKPYRARGERARRASSPARRRKRRPNLRRRLARARGKHDLRLERQWVAEIPYRPERSRSTYRLILRRQRIEEYLQGELFELWRYRYVLTNLPPSTSARDVIDLTYQRCDQENVIEQLQHGIAGMRMPTGGLLSNAAFLTCARFAHNLKAWLAQLALPRETMRWEWKRFRHAFVYIAARVLRQSRQIQVRLARSHPMAPTILLAHARLQS
ncbi:MAG: IS1380 family transposase [Planctomycetota bacterium]